MNYHYVFIGLMIAQAICACLVCYFNYRVAFHNKQVLANLEKIEQINRQREALARQ
jgi:hypothetical protein